jgi:hypothetical protein
MLFGIISRMEKFTYHLLNFLFKKVFNLQIFPNFLLVTKIIIFMNNFYNHKKKLINSFLQRNFHLLKNFILY